MDNADEDGGMQFIKKKAANRTQTKATKSAVNGQTDPNSEGFVFPSLAALQRAFRIAYPTAQEWKRRGMPAREDGKTYSLPAVIEWLQERKPLQAPGSEANAFSQDIRKQKAALELEKEQIDVESRRLKLRRDMGDLVSREVALTKQRQQNAEIRRQLEAIPGRLARIFPSEYRDDLVLELENQIYLILRRFALGEKDEDDEIPS